MLGEKDLCVEDGGAHLTPEMAGPVAHQLDLILALFVTHQTNKVKFTPVTLNVSVEVTFLCKSFVANIAGKRLVNYC